MDPSSGLDPLPITIFPVSLSALESAALVVVVGVPACGWAPVGAGRGVARPARVATVPRAIILGDVMDCSGTFAALVVIVTVPTLELRETCGRATANAADESEIGHTHALVRKARQSRRRARAECLVNPAANAPVPGAVLGRRLCREVRRSHCRSCSGGRGQKRGTRECERSVSYCRCEYGVIDGGDDEASAGVHDAHLS